MVDHVFPVLDSDGEANFSHPDTSDECNSWNKELCDSTSQDKEEDLQGTSWRNGISASRQAGTELFISQAGKSQQLSSIGLTAKLKRDYKNRDGNNQQTFSFHG